MMTINEVRELKTGDTVVFNGGNSAVVMEIQAFGNDRIKYVLKDSLGMAFHYDDVDISRIACGSYRGLSMKSEAIKRSCDKYIDYCKHDIECTKEMYKQIVNTRYGIGTARMLPEIADVIFNGPATIVQWTDGTKTVVKCSKGENFDPEKGLAMAIAKKALGNKGNYYEVFKKFIPEDKTISTDDSLTIRPTVSNKFNIGDRVIYACLGDMRLGIIKEIEILNDNFLYTVESKEENGTTLTVRLDEKCLSFMPV